MKLKEILNILDGKKILLYDLKDRGDIADFNADSCLLEPYYNTEVKKIKAANYDIFKIELDLGGN